MSQTKSNKLREVERASRQLGFKQEQSSFEQAHVLGENDVVAELRKGKQKQWVTLRWASDRQKIRRCWN